MGGFFDDIIGGFDDIIGGIGDFFGNSNNLSSILTAGTSLFSNIVKQDAADAQIKAQLDAQREAEKFKYLTDLAKLKYGSSGGGGGGGGGSLRNKNADLIEVLSSNSDDRLKALEQFTAGYVNSYK